jgi:branched-chain amino acid transport system substrate-binding protein
VTTVAELPRRSELFVVVAPGVSPAGLPTGAMSGTAFKDPSDPRWAGDPGLAPFRRVLKDAVYAEGAAAAFALVDALRRAGKGLTRASVLAAARRLNEADNPFVVPGIVIKPPIRQVALERWVGGHWNIVSGPLAVSG